MPHCPWMTLGTPPVFQLLPLWDHDRRRLGRLLDSPAWRGQGRLSEEREPAGRRAGGLLTKFAELRAACTRLFYIGR